MDRRHDRGQATRQHIVATATRLFAADGYEGISIERVLRDCGMSRGALYHHFPGKEALFTAVLEAMEAEVAEAIGAAAQDAANPLDALRVGCTAWLRLAREPAVRQIVLIDAPAVLGWQRWRAIEARYGLGLLKSALAMAAAAGRLRPGMVELYAHVLLAMLTELALVIARSEDANTAIRSGAEAVEQVLSGLFGVAPNEPW